MAGALCYSGSKLIGQAYKQFAGQDAYVGMAEYVARAGINDALAWFIRQNRVVAANAANCCQPGQSVTFGVSPYSTGLTYTYPSQAFEPQFTNSIHDTDNASVGIVKDFPLDNPDPAKAKYFGHYEVWRKQSATAQPTTDPVAAYDLSGERLSTTQVNGNGIFWDITSVGTVYKRLSQAVTVVNGINEWVVAFNTPPNVIIAKTTETQEFRKLTGTMPLPVSLTNSICGAVYCQSQTQVTLNAGDNALIRGKAPISITANAFVFDNLASAASSGSCTYKANGQDSTNVTGNSYCSGPVSLLYDTNVFGMPLADIKPLADYVGDNLGNAMQQCFDATGAPCSEPKLYYFDGNLTYDPTLASPYTQLNAFGVLIVNGNLTINSGNNNNNSLFIGLIFCTGNVVFQPGTIITGAVILGINSLTTTGTVYTLKINGATDNQAMIVNNPSMVQYIMNRVCTYRTNTSPKKNFLTVPNW